MKTQFEINFNNKTILFKKLRKNINNYITIALVKNTNLNIYNRKREKKTDF